jgi:hypothetical protein
MNWATWIGAACAIAGLLLAARPLHWAYQLMVGTHDFIADWPRVRTAITSLQQEVAEVKAETRPNGGSSMRDVVARTAADVADIKHEQALMRDRMEQLENLRAGREKGKP